MINKKNVSKRNFIKQSLLGFGAGSPGFGAGIISISNPSISTEHINESKKLLSEICVASVDLKEHWPDTTTLLY